jgi:Ca-activated chloride channel family protein
MKRISLVIGILVIALVGAFVAREVVNVHKDPVVVVQWANSHPMRDGLLPKMAADFNAADHKTPSGRPIEIKLVPCDSDVQASDLAARVNPAKSSNETCGDANPTIITPQSDDWLGDVNFNSGHAVIDLNQAKSHSIAKTWIGIVTYRDIAACLGWAGKSVGYADLIALRSTGWPNRECVRAARGERPLLAFTNPRTSTTGRDVLISVYSIAANKKPSELTEGDIETPEVKEKVRQFQTLVDHYMPGTIPLNTKIDQGRRYGHFFLMPEDNLVNLYKGNEKAIGRDGQEHTAKPVRDLVMIYPKEGSALNSNPAAIVRASWVSPEETDAARAWIDYLRDDAQQRDFMRAGFRPGTQLPVGGSVNARYGLDPKEPANATIEPGDVRPSVVQAMMNRWGDVKKPAIVTFVVDTSGSMSGGRLHEAKRGLTDVLANMELDNQVGLVSFSTTVSDEVLPGPLSDVAGPITEKVDALHADGQTDLYDAVRRGIAMSDDTQGPDGATRAVVVLSDGYATAGGQLDQLVRMIDRKSEAGISWTGIGEALPSAESDGVVVAKGRVRGDKLLVSTAHPVQVFFVGFGEADIDVGRVLAQATGGEYVGSTEQDLAAVITDLGPYF